MRSSGILMHLSSLPSPGGIGTMGRPARDFVDFLAAAGQSCWQLLPICPTSYGDSPYQFFSTFAGNPYFIDLEDLGFLTDSVRQLLKDSGFPGMKVLELAFDSRDASGSDYLPHCYPTHCVAYTGTHDNDTALGWLSSADPADTARARDYLRLTGQDDHWGMMRALWGSEARVNTPSTVGNNWRWRALPGSFTPELAQRLRHCMELYDRLPNT